MLQHRAEISSLIVILLGLGGCDALKSVGMDEEHERLVRIESPDDGSLVNGYHMRVEFRLLAVVDSVTISRNGEDHWRSTMEYGSWFDVTLKEGDNRVVVRAYRNGESDEVAVGVSTDVPVTKYRVTAMGDPSEVSSVATDINERGEIAGTRTYGDGSLRAFWAFNGSSHPLGEGSPSSSASRINESGLVLGSVETSLCLPHWTYQSVLWDGPTRLATLPCGDSATDLNDADMILFARHHSNTEAYSWRAGAVDTIPLRDPRESNGLIVPEAARFNTRGEVATAAHWGAYEDRTMYSYQGRVEVLCRGCVFLDINERGDVLTTNRPDLRNKVPFRLHLHGDDTAPIGVFGGDPYRSATMNDVRQIAGINTVPFLWENGRFSRIHIEGEQWELLRITALNNSGYIVGQARRGATGAPVAVLLTPFS